MYRGEIWWANLPESTRSEPGYRRPVLVVQDDAFNRSRIQTIVVVILTTNVELGEMPGNVLLPCQETGLLDDSVANVSQIFTLDKTRLTERVGSIPSDFQDQVDDGLRLVLYL